MLTNCFRFAPHDSVPGLIAKICKYLKDHPGWSAEEIAEEIQKFVESAGVESFNGRTGDVVLAADDVNNLRIATAYFAEGDEVINDLDLSTLYKNGIRFVFTNFNTVTSGYDLGYALELFSDDNVVYYPLAVGGGGGSGSVLSVNGKTGTVVLSLGDILGDSGAQVKLCTATEFTSSTIETWNAYYESGFRLVCVVNDEATAVDFLYVLKQDVNNHQPIMISSGSGESAVTSVNSMTGAVTIPVVDVSGGDSEDIFAKMFINENEDYPIVPAVDSYKLGGKAPAYYMPYTNLADNSDFTKWVAQAGIAGKHGNETYGGDRWILTSGTIEGDPNENEDGSERGDGYTNITLNGTLVQVVPYPFPAEATLFVEMVSGTADESYYDADKGEIVLISAGGVIKNVLLLEGAWTEKPEYVAKGYGAELAECELYFLRIDDNFISSGYITGASKGFVFSLHKRMRTNPAIKVGATFTIRTIAGYSAAANYATPTSPERATADGSSVIYTQLTWGAELGTNNTPATAQIRSGYIDYSADLARRG